MNATLERTTDIAVVRAPRAGAEAATPVVRSLLEQLRILAVDPVVRALVIHDPSALVADADDLDWEIASLCTAIANLGCASIALIDGDCLGRSFEVALAADIRLARDGAMLGFHDQLIDAPTPGSTLRLRRFGGEHTAFHMILTGDSIDAGEAQRLGLVSRVVRRESLFDEGLAVAEQIALCAPLAVRAVKELADRGLDHSLQHGMAMETDYYMSLQASHDRLEGIQAFVDKRPPVFQGY